MNSGANPPIQTNIRYGGESKTSGTIWKYGTKLERSSADCVRPLFGDYPKIWFFFGFCEDKLTVVTKEGLASTMGFNVTVMLQSKNDESPKINK